MRKKRGIFKRILAWIIVLAMVVTMMPTVYAAVSPQNETKMEANSQSADVTSILTDLSATLKQTDDQNNDNIIGDNDVINPDKDVTADISFKVPVMGDAVENYVKKGDTAQFTLAKNFALKTSAKFALTYQVSEDGQTIQKKVGTLEIKTDSNDEKKLIANVTFDGDDDVFDGSWSDVNVLFSCLLKYNGDAAGSGEDNQTAMVLEKTYKVKAPVKETVVSANKSATRDGSVITWKVDVTGKQDEKAVDIAGYTFSDDLSQMNKWINNKQYKVEYVAGSFKVGNTDDYASAVKVADPAEGTTTLTYTFPEGSTGTQYVYFQTKVPNEWMYADGNQSVGNTAKIYEPGNTTNPKVSPYGSISWTNNWVSKAVKEKNAKEGTITYTITANTVGAHLFGTKITDELDSSVDGNNEHDNLTFVSAYYQKQINGVWDTSTTSITPADGVYSLGEINTPILLTITAKLKDGSTPEHVVYETKNQAKLSWEYIDTVGNYPGYANTGIVPGNIGMNPITKSAGNYNQAEHTVPWTVNVGESDVAVSLYVTDLLVYGSSLNESEISSVTPSGTAGGQDINTETVKKLLESGKVAYNQKFKADSFASSTGATGSVYTVKNASGTVVADLLVVTNIEPTASEAEKYSYTSIITNPAIYLGSGSVSNTAHLMSLNVEINHSTASKSVDGRMMNKDVLTQADAAGIAEADDSGLIAIANRNAGGDWNSFNYKDKSTVFRIHVNMRNVRNTTGDLDGAGNIAENSISVVEELPSGWELADIKENTEFLVFKGTGNGNIVTAEKLTTLDAENISVSKENGKVTFTFKNMDGAYLILLRLKPTSETQNTYFDGNKDSWARNTATLNYTKNGQVTNLGSDYEDIKITSSILNKSYDASKADSDGYLTWDVSYKPAELERTNCTHITDVLPEGLDLRMDKDGNLMVTDGELTCLAIHKLTLEADGSYKEDGNIPIVLTGDNANASYDAATRTLTFKIEDSKQAYRFNYVTDVTATKSITLKNTVTLSTGESTKVNQEASYTSSSAAASATMQRSGWIQIAKSKVDSSPLAGAKFVIYREDKTKVLRSGTTGTDGVLRLIGLPDGTYYLQETEAPEGYKVDGTMHEIVVATENGVRTTTVNGHVTDNTNLINLVNYEIGTTDVKISKVDAVGGAELAGAELTITGDTLTEQGRTISWTSDGSVHTVLGLKAGEYTLTENQAPLGYDKTENIIFKIDDKGIISVKQSNTFAPVNNSTVVMTDKRTQKDVTISKVDVIGGAELPGATLTVTGTGITTANALNYSWTSGETPKTIKLGFGEYTLTENQAPTGYNKTETISFKIDKDGTVSIKQANNSYVTSADSKIVMEDARTQRTVKISKIDAVGGAEVPGATLKVEGPGITDANKDQYTWVSSDKPKEITLGFGTYTLTETIAPTGAGYDLNSTSVSFTVDKDGKISGSTEKNGIVTITNERTKRNVIISKTDIVDGSEIAGASMSITGDGLDSAITWTSEAGVNKTVQLGFGEYTLTEDKAPLGYDTAETISFKVETDGTIKVKQTDNSYVAVADSKVVMKDARTQRDVTISKVDVIGGAELSGATLTVAGTGITDVNKADYTWVSDGTAKKIKLGFGEYTLTEDQAPLGYNKAETISFKVDENGKVSIKQAGSYVVATDSKVVMEDARTQRDVTISKVDAVGGAELAGATLTVAGTGITEANKADYTWTSNGTAKQIKLGFGEYTLTEDKAPLGYDKAETISFKVETDGTVKVKQTDGSYAAVADSKVVMKDARTQRDVTISKVDVIGGAELSGATLTVAGTGITDVNKADYTWVSDGTAKKIKLGFGEYTLTEDKTPLGYDTAETITFKVDENGKVSIKQAGGTYVVAVDSKVVMEDARTQRTVKISKIDAVGGAEVAGATLKVEGPGITDANKDQYTWVSTDESKEISLGFGTYTLTETLAPENAGYDLNSTSVSFTVGKDGTVIGSTVKNGIVTITNERTKRNVIISKTDVVGGSEIAGASMSITGDGLDSAITWTSEAGINKTVQLGFGEYTLTENQAPLGYDKAETITFKVETDGTVKVKQTDGKFVDTKNSTVEMVDARTQYDINISKVDVGGIEIAGATIKITGTGLDNPITWISEAGKTHLVKLGFGEYEMTEVIAPAGMKKITTVIKFSVNKDGKVTVTSDDSRAVSLVEKDGETPKISIKNEQIIVSFEKVSRNDTNNTLKDCYFDVEGIFVGNGDSVNVINGNGNNDGSVKALTTLLGGKLYASATEDINKLLANKKISDIEPGIYDVSKYLGDNDVSAHLVYVYSIKETQEPGGFQIEPKTVKFVVDQQGIVQVLNDDGTITAGTNSNTIKFSDPTIQVSFVKKGEDGTQLEGAKFDLTGKFADGSTIQTFTSDAKNESVINGLLISGETYTLTEAESPNGYQKLKNAITFTVDSYGKMTIVNNQDKAASVDDAQAVMSIVNKVVEPETPSNTNDVNTGDTTNVAYLLILMLLAITTATIVVVKGKKVK